MNIKKKKNQKKKDSKKKNQRGKKQKKRKKDKETIKLAENECPINENLMLYDISIAIKGPEEELAYLKHPNYISIIRRGNTLMEVYKYVRGDYEYKYSLLIRKGMKKFIDLPQHFFREKTKEELKEEEEEKKKEKKEGEEEEEEEEKYINKYTLNFDLDQDSNLF